MKPSKYLKEIGALLSGVECTYKGGKKVDMDEAVIAVSTMLVEAASDGHTVMAIGNGGSAAMSAHFTEDLVKLRGMRAMSFDSAPLLTCLGNDIGFNHVYEFPVKIFANDGVTFAVSSSGQSDDILRAARAASRRRCAVVTLSGFTPNNPLRRAGNVNFFVPSESYGMVESAHAAILHCIVDCKETK